MIKEEEKYTTLDTEQCKWWVNTLFNMAKEKACNSGNFDDGEEIQAAQDKIIKALEQSSDDVMAIHTQGLAEGIRCAMCTNSMKSNRGCDGGCVVDNEMYKKVMDTINNQIFNQPTSDDCVSRQAVLDLAVDYGTNSATFLIPVCSVKNLPSVTLTFPNGITNGDVVEKIFGKDVYCTLIRMMYSSCCEKLKTWWNAPYKRGNEE